MSEAPENLPQASLAPSERLKFLLQNPANTLQVLVAHVANGGTITTLCDTWEVSYAEVLRWLYADRAREREYVRALNDRAEWAKETLLAQLRDIALVDIRQVFDDNGHIKAIDQWPKALASALASFEVVDEYDDEGVKTGTLKKFKLYDKLKAIDLLGKNLALFVERHEINGKLTLEHLVASTGLEKKDD